MKANEDTKERPKEWPNILRSAFLPSSLFRCCFSFFVLHFHPLPQHGSGGAERTSFVGGIFIILASGSS